MKNITNHQRLILYVTFKEDITFMKNKYGKSRNQSHYNGAPCLINSLGDGVEGYRNVEISSQQPSWVVYCHSDTKYCWDFANHIFGLLSEEKGEYLVNKTKPPKNKNAKQQSINQAIHYHQNTRSS